MSEPQQPPVPPSAQPSAAPPAPPATSALPAEPQYPTSGQHSAAPQYAAPQQYPAQPQYAAQPQYPATSQHPAPRTGNALGRVALIIALLSVGMRLLTSLLYPLVYPGADWTIGAFTVGTTGIALLGYLTAMVLGVIAARRPGPHLWAGIAIGLSAAYLITLVIEWASSMLYRFL